MIKNFIKLFAHSIGCEIRRRDPYGYRFQGYDLEQEAYANIQSVRTYTMATYPRLVTLYQQVVFCETHNIPGSFVECGTWKGGSVGLMALGNLKYGSAQRHLHLFDSFEGVTR